MLQTVFLAAALYGCCCCMINAIPITGYVRVPCDIIFMRHKMYINDSIYFIYDSNSKKKDTLAETKGMFCLISKNALYIA